MDSTFQTMCWQEGMAVSVGEVVRVRLDTEAPHTPTKTVAGDRMESGGLDSQAQYQRDFAPAIVKGTP
jgi:hypothetical protein